MFRRKQTNVTANEMTVKKIKVSNKISLPSLLKLFTEGMKVQLLLPLCCGLIGEFSEIVLNKKKKAPFWFSL